VRRPGGSSWGFIIGGCAIVDGGGSRPETGGAGLRRVEHGKETKEEILELEEI